MSTTITTSFVSIVGTYQVDIQDVSAFAKIATESVAQTVNKRGCLYFLAAQDVARPGVFHLSEGWASQADLDEHIASPDFQRTLEQAFKLRILSREIYVSESKGRTLMA
ncbi:putative quinol monooxygenase [Chitinimonas naiadis]